MARPTKLTEALVKQAEEFVVSRREDRTLLPTVEGLALELHIHRDTVYDWAEIDETSTPLQRRFSDIVGDLKSAQAEKLVQYSLIGKYNSTIAKLILSGKHGYVEKSASDITTGGEAIQFINDVPRPNDETSKST